jgi:uncharacterized protein DUF7009
MKLRIKGDSLRLRIAPSELARLMQAGRIEETIHFGQDADARLIYAVEHADVRELAVRYEESSVTAIVPTGSARAWAQGDDVGVYGSVAVATGRLEIAIEKDWACLDKSDSDHADTFPNPKLDARC